MRYGIIPAEPGHVAKLADIERAAARQFPEALLPPHRRDDVIPHATHEQARRAGRLWVATDGSGEPVGFAVVTVVDALPHLLEMDVLPAHSRQGLGTRLLAAITDWARASGHSALTLTTFRALPWNQPFYERRGFRVLSPGELSPGLLAILEQEARAGLAPTARVAMRLEL